MEMGRSDRLSCVYILEFCQSRRSTMGHVDYL